MSSLETRWSKSVSVLHWAAAMLVVGLLTAGLIMTRLDPTDPLRRILGMLHTISGNLLGVLTLARLVVRARTTPAGPLDVGPAHRRGVAIVHGLLYAVPIATIVTGLATVLRSAWHPYLTGEVALPPAFDSLASRQVHEALSTLLALLVVVHVVGAIVHERRHGKTLRRIVPFMR